MKVRLDTLLVQHGLADSIEKAKAMIGAGEVYVSDTIADKAGVKYNTDIVLRVKEKCRYVSRGGLKLEKGLEHFNIATEMKICIDVGASSGGFTDCLLQHGAGKVFALDVAYGQLNWKIRQDERVAVIERFNARNIQPDTLGEQVDLAVMDTSFISITKIIPALFPIFSDSGIKIVALIKPQFELPKGKIGKGGVVKDSELHQEAIEKVKQFAISAGLLFHGTVTSPIRGPKGNTEFLTYLTSP